MAQLKLKSIDSSKLDNTSRSKGYLYKDLSFDIGSSYATSNQLNNKKSDVRDLAAIYDIEAIKNSIATAFTTAPGQKILNPLFGVDLRRFVFEQVDSFVADQIQYDIEVSLPRWEPRIRLIDVNVIADEDQQTFYIDIQVDIPSLDITGLSLKSELNNDGYFIS